MNQTLTPERLAGFFDHTLLKPYATKKDFENFCNNCKQYRFAMAAVNPSAVQFCKQYLNDTTVHVGAAIGFPLGQNTLETKRFETLDAIQNGADEIDYVINITQLKEKNYTYIADEMHAVVDLCQENKKISKVIFETCSLSDAEKRELCRIVRDVRPDYVKTSTGFGSGGATLEDVALLLECVGDIAKVKASGGIRTLDFVLQLIDMGVSRIGSSNSVNLVEEYRSSLH